MCSMIEAERLPAPHGDRAGDRPKAERAPGTIAKVPSVGSSAGWARANTSAERITATTR